MVMRIPAYLGYLLLGKHEPDDFFAFRESEH
jgi:hypothetical protein